MSYDTYINNLMDKSYQEYIKPIININNNFYRLFDNNLDDDRIIINGKIEQLLFLPNNFNKILNIDISYRNVVHIPMASNLYIEYLDSNELLDIKNLDINNQYISNNNLIKILSIKSNNNMIYQDILIETNNTLIIVQIYKFKIPIHNITHGAFIIYQNDFDNLNNNNTIYSIKLNNKLALKLINDIDYINIKNKQKKIKQLN